MPRPGPRICKSSLFITIRSSNGAVLAVGDNKKITSPRPDTALPIAAVIVFNGEAGEFPGAKSVPLT